ncbi:hypothetical protein LguiA_006393 [Lonicera macranthoides]
MFNVNHQIGKEKRMMFGNIKGGGVDDRELEMLLNEIPQVTYLSHLHHQNQNENQNENHHHRHHHHQTSSNNNINNNLLSPLSCSSFSNGFGASSEDDASSPSLLTTPFDDTTTTSYRTGGTLRNFFNSRLFNNSNEHMVDEFGLSETLNRMQIGEDDYKDNFSNRMMINPDEFEFTENGFNPCNVDNYYPTQRFNGDFHDYGGVRWPSICQNSKSSDDDDIKLAKLLGLREGCNVGNSMYSDPKIDYLMELAKEQQRGYCNGGIQFPGSSFNDGFYPSQHCGIDSTVDPTSTLKSLHSKLYNPSVLKQSRAIPNGKVLHPSLLSMADTADLEGFTCEDSFIIQGKALKYVVEKGCDRSRAQKKSSRSDISGQRGGSYSPQPLQPTFGSLAEVQGSIYFLAKDQQGCRFLQKIFDEGSSQDVQIIFNEIIDHIVELMMDPFGNYLIQKLLDVGSEEQRMLIVVMVTREPGELLRICLNSHGTRVVQKLIGSLTMRQQISLVILALEPGFLDLIKDVHGNHVVQRCLQCLGKEHTKFIFNAAAKFCVNIATHRHGCCVLNRCIAHSTGKHREQLISEIAANALLLSQDAFGNYVIQYIIELKIPSAAAALLSQFEGHYIHLSMQKFSSHVVEKCLRCCEESRSRIVPELLTVPHFDQLLQHPFSNYVVQSALEVTKGRLHAALVEAVQPHMILRSSPYCKKLFSRNLLKK